MRWYNVYFMFQSRWIREVIHDYPSNAVAAQQMVEYVLGLPCYIKEIVK